jgi:hypothetical protein
MFEKDRSCDHEANFGPVDVWIVEEIESLRRAVREKYSDEFVVVPFIIVVVSCGENENDGSGT